MAEAAQAPIESAAQVEGSRIPGLSGIAADFLRRHPREACAALESAAARYGANHSNSQAPAAAVENEDPDEQEARALEAAKALYEEMKDSDPYELPESLKPFFVDSPKSPDLLGAAQAAERLGVSPQTVYNWANKGTLLAWKGPDRLLTIPAGQILGPRKVVPRLAEIVDIIGDAELAWDFLTEEWPFADDFTYPLEKLKAGQIEEVLATAPAFDTTFT